MDEGRGVVDLGSWFDSSCVVDASGAPLVMFHGTGADVGRHFRPLSFFSQSPEIAQIYALAPTRQVEGSGPNIVPCYLRILNPYMHDDQATGENLSHAVLGRRGTHLQVMDELLERVNSLPHALTPWGRTCRPSFRSAAWCRGTHLLHADR